MTDLLNSALEAALHAFNFITDVILPALPLVLIAFGFAYAVVKFFELCWTVILLQSDVKYLRKELERQRNELIDLRYKSIK